MTKYGSRNIAGMLKQWNELREAVKSGQREVIEEKFSACEEWIDFAFAPIDHVSAAADMLASWDEWFSGFGGDKVKADRLSVASCFAIEAARKHGKGDEAPTAIMRSFLQAMVDPMHEDLDYLRAAPASGAEARARRDAKAVGYKGKVQ